MGYALARNGECFAETCVVQGDEMEIQIDLDNELDDLEDNLEQEYVLYCPHGELIVRGSVDEPPRLWLIGSHGVIDSSLFHAVSSEQARVFCSIPGAVRFMQEAVPLVERVLPAVALFADKRLRLLEFAVNVGMSAVEMIEDCPALAYLLVSRTGWLELDRALKVQAVLARRKRHEILSALGLPDSKWFARMLRKIPAGECFTPLMEQVFEIVRAAEGGDPWAKKKMKILRHHVRWINRLQIDIFHDKDVFSLLASSFFDDIGQLAFLRNQEIIFDDLVEIRRILDQEVVAERKIPPIRSVAELASVHERLVDLLSSRKTLAKYKNVPFPVPPLQGISVVDGVGRSEILPLNSGESLWQEGRSMHHCIFSYFSFILEDAGRLYAYHISMADGEQATVLLQVSREAVPRIKEIQGICNGEVSPELIAFVNNWLRDNL